jgi:hypothetical protein
MRETSLTRPVISQFKMPGDALIPHYHERLQASEAGISTRLFLQHGLLPTLRAFSVKRALAASRIAARVADALRGRARRAKYTSDVGRIRVAHNLTRFCRAPEARFQAQRLTATVMLLC